MEKGLGKSSLQISMKRKSDKTEITPLGDSCAEGTLTLKNMVAVLGPGMMVCLADSDIGGLFTMAVAGARWGYGLLGLQLLLIPVLFAAQELVVVLGVCRRRSLVGLVQQELGETAAALLMVSCLLVGASAVISELSGVVAVGELMGLTPMHSCAIAAVMLIFLVVGGDYRAVERVGLCLGACLSVFMFTAFICKPPWGEIALEIVKPPSLQTMKSAEFREVVSANIGTVVTPWMLFYQMSAIVEKRLTPKDLPLAKLDTAVGAVTTQVIMSSVLVTFAVTARNLDLEALPLRDVFLLPLRSLLGEHITVILMAMGLLGASLLASLVASLGVAWNIADYLGEESPLKRRMSDAPWFYVGYAGVVLGGAFVVGTDKINVVTLNLAIQVLNGVCMPGIVGATFVLATKNGVVPPEHQLRGWYAWFIGTILFLCSVLAMWMSLQAVPHVYQQIRPQL